eukprot:4392910-Amphidinium_carterae.1
MRTLQERQTQDRLQLPHKGGTQLRRERVLLDSKRSTISAVLCGLGKGLGLDTWQRGHRRACAHARVAQRQQCSKSFCTAHGFGATKHILCQRREVLLKAVPTKLNEADFLAKAVPGYVLSSTFKPWDLNTVRSGVTCTGVYM